MQASKTKSDAISDNSLAEDYMKIQSESRELLKLVETVEQTKRYQRQLLVLQEQNVQILNILKGRESAKVVNASLQRAVENLIAQIEELKLDQEVEQKKIVALKKEIEERKIDPETLRPIKVKPAGSGVVGTRRLYVLEASGGTLIAHRYKEPELRISQGSIGIDKRYNEYLRGAAMNRTMNSDGLMLFLVRPDGYGSYNRGAGWAEQTYKLKTVKVPIPQKGRIDLAQFMKYMVPIEERFAPGKSKSSTKKKAPAKKPAPKKK